jgi:hypothetical protein
MGCASAPIVAGVGAAPQRTRAAPSEKIGKSAARASLRRFADSCFFGVENARHAVPPRRLEHGE